MRFLLPMALLLLALPLAPANPLATQSEAPACPDVVHVADVGLACRDRDGLLRVHDAAGGFLGWTHGGDGIPTREDVIHTIRKKPTCVDAAVSYDQEPRAVVIYARAHDDEDRYSAKAPTIRDLVHAANGYVYTSGKATGAAASLKVECLDGVVAVHEAVLATPKAAAGFGTIANDLRSQGFNEAAARYWVYYDDRGACACGGMANLISDDSPSPFNLNNGYLFLAYAITFGYDSARVMLHELGHTMGAVQLSAPRSTGAGHCIDGRDIMCYNDGGRLAHLYRNTRCSSMVWDCGHDDYFDATPAPNEYLATHWNLGSRFNRFIAFGNAVNTPVMDVGVPIG